ncbi:hybrid sensor histidine kinase/response regulator [Pseudoduganella umbonata]|nr:ATP-binding protein [Pseudoduganella umbonata]
MRVLVAEHDWAATPLGPIPQWPASLKAIVTLMLDSTEPLVIWWGEESIQIYNDAYAPRVDAGQGTIALGRPAAESWKHGWASIAPLVSVVLGGGPPTVHSDFRYGIERNNRVVDTYWTYSFTPVRDDAGAVRGVLLISYETTERILGTRRQQTLDLLRQELVTASTLDRLDAAVDQAVAFNSSDLCSAKLTPLEPVATPPDPSVRHVRVTAADVGLHVDLAIDFEPTPRIALDDAYRLFVEQFTLLVATARHRVDSEALRRIVEAERDRLLLDAPVGAAVMIGEELVYHLVNSMYAMVSGRPAEHMIGKPFVRVFPELDGSPVHEQFKAVYRAGQPFISQPTLVQIHRHGGALDNRYFTYNLSPLRTLAGQVYGLMVIAVDITVQVESRAEVEKLNVDLQAAARAKDEFLALLGHELRNPLAPIVTALELMRMRDGSTEREQVVIRRQVAHLTRLVDDLLDVSRITRGKVELRKETVDAREVLMRAVEMVAPLVAQKQQRLQVEVASLPWYGDAARLAQIVSNLLTNASRYSPAGAEIMLRAGAAGGEIRIDVSDNGTGLPAELLPRIFEPFVQGERNLDGAVGGLGIGLALVRNLVELHGGRVAASSEGPGTGSIFTVHLPLAAAPPRPRIEVPLAQVEKSGTAQSILVVDDNVDAADTLAALLRSHGHAVTVCHAPAEALERFAELRVDLAILDIGLPEISGHQLVGLMRESGRNANARYVALTGYGQDADRERSGAAGFALHLVKPLAPEALEKLLGSR